MNVIEAVKILKKLGCSVQANDSDGKTFSVKFPRGLRRDVNARELIKLARLYTSDNKFNTAISSRVKAEDNRKNRSHTRDAIAKNDWEKIPLNGKVAEGNPWNWD